MREFKPGYLVFITYLHKQVTSSMARLISSSDQNGEVNLSARHMHDRRKHQCMFHVNMLNGYQVQAVMEDNFYADELEKDIPVWNEKRKRKATFGEE